MLSGRFTTAKLCTKLDGLGITHELCTGSQDTVNQQQDGVLADEEMPNIGS